MKQHGIAHSRKTMRNRHGGRAKVMRNRRSGGLGGCVKKAGGMAEKIGTGDWRSSRAHQDITFSKNGSLNMLIIIWSIPCIMVGWQVWKARSQVLGGAFCP